MTRSTGSTRPATSTCRPDVRQPQPPRGARAISKASSTNTATGSTLPFGNVWVPRGIEPGLAALLQRPLDLAAPVRLDLVALRALGLVDVPLRPLALGLDLGWYWIPMNVWGPAWVNWWWDDFYFGWAPISYWGYPGHHHRQFLLRPRLDDRRLSLRLPGPDRRPQGPAPGHGRPQRRPRNDAMSSPSAR